VVVGVSGKVEKAAILGIRTHSLEGSSSCSALSLLRSCRAIAHKPLLSRCPSRGFGAALVWSRKCRPPAVRRAGTEQRCATSCDACGGRRLQRLHNFDAGLIPSQGCETPMSGILRALIESSAPLERQGLTHLPFWRESLSFGELVGGEFLGSDFTILPGAFIPLSSS